MRKIAILAFAAMLAGCSTFAEVVHDLTPDAPASAGEIKTVAAASAALTAADRVALPYMQTAACDADCKSTIANTSHVLRVDLDAALDAEIAGHSGARDAALLAFNQVWPAFMAYLVGKGLTP